MGTDDAELMLAFKAGDESAFGKLVERHQVPLINHFHRLLFDRHIAEDLTQEVFLRIDRHKASYEPIAKFTTYLYRIARNCWIDHLRRTKHERGLRSLDAANEEELNLYARVPAETDSPADSARKGEFAELLIGAIQELPEGHRLVFVMGIVDEMKYAEIAEALEVPVGTVKSRMHNALTKLRSKLAGVLKKRARIEES